MSKYYKAEDVIAFLNLHCPKDMWEYQIADLPTIEVSEDCISREDLIKSFLADCECESREEARAVTLKLDYMLELIDDAPSVIPKAKKGEWHRISADKYVQHAYHFFRCSECGEDTIGEPNYCPNCGAKMKG